MSREYVFGGLAMGASVRRLVAVVGAVLMMVLAGAFAAASPAAAANAVIVSKNTSSATAASFANALQGTGVSAITGVSYTGSNEAIGTFTNGTSTVGIDSGVVLDSGKVDDLPGNATYAPSTDFSLPGDPALNTLTGQTTYDAAVLEFTATPATTALEFSYTFTSGEFDFFGTVYNDGLGLYINGVNCALFPSGQTVALNNLMNATNAPSYIANNTLTRDVQQGALSTPLTCRATVTAGVPINIKIALADAADGSLDSALFLKNASLTSLPPTTLTYTGPTSATTGQTAVLTARLTDEGGSPVAGKTATFVIEGQAYTAITDSNGVATVTTAVLLSPASTSLPFSVQFDSDSTYATSGANGSISITAPAPVTAPAPPQNITGSSSGNGSAVVAWDAPSSTGGSPITSYTITASPEGASCTLPLPASPLQCTITGLTNGATYTFTGTATNAIGTSGPSSASAAVVIGSGAPTSGRQPWSASPTGTPPRVAKFPVVFPLLTESQISGGAALKSLTAKVCVVRDSRVITLGPGTCRVKVTVGSSKTIKTFKVSKKKTSNAPGQAAMKRVSLVLFAPDKAGLTKSAKATLTRVAKLLIGNESIVIGHTYNAQQGNGGYKLSLARANNVGKFLRLKKVDRITVIIGGTGSDVPTGSAVRDRRVVVYLLK